MGHDRGPKGVDEQFVYIVQLGDGSLITLSPKEFAEWINGKNDPRKTRLMKLELRCRSGGVDSSVRVADGFEASS